MLELYIRLVIGGKRTVESVPEQFREDVRKAISKAEEADS